MQFFEVGGCVRDEILGQPSKDIDYTVVLNEGDFVPRRTKAGKMFQAEPFEVMVEELERRGFRIWKKDKPFLTVRAQFPRASGSLAIIKHAESGLTADFVLARKDGEYTDGRRPDEVTPGTLFDDLRRRDFTMNAIAKDTEGNLIDPFDGRGDISMGIIRAVGDPFERLSEDSLRAVRALRFMVTKNMTLDPDLIEAMVHPTILDNIVHRISDERIDIELRKMLAADSFRGAMALSYFPLLTHAMLAGSVSLTSTMKKQKG